MDLSALSDLAIVFAFALLFVMFIVPRITSYNVCYTKLLRPVVDLVEGPAAVGADVPVDAGFSVAASWRHVTPRRRERCRQRARGQFSYNFV